MREKGEREGKGKRGVTERERGIEKAGERGGRETGETREISGRNLKYLVSGWYFKFPKFCFKKIPYKILSF